MHFLKLCAYLQAPKENDPSSWKCSDALSSLPQAPQQGWEQGFPLIQIWSAGCGGDGRLWICFSLCGPQRRRSCGPVPGGGQGMPGIRVLGKRVMMAWNRPWMHGKCMETLPGPGASWGESSSMTFAVWSSKILMFYLHKQAWVLVNSLVVGTLILQLITFEDLGNLFPKICKSLFPKTLVVDICSHLLRPHVISLSHWTCDVSKPQFSRQT